MSLGAIHRDTDRMTRIQKSVDELQAGYHTNSIIDDFRIQHVQRSFMAYDQRIAKYRIVRVGRDFQISSMHQRAWDIQKKEQISAHVVFVLCRRQNRPNRFETS